VNLSEKKNSLLHRLAGMPEFVFLPVFRSVFMRFLSVLFVLLMSPALSSADVVITVGNATVAVGTSSVVVPITISGSPAIKSATVSFAVTAAGAANFGTATLNAPVVFGTQLSHLDQSIFDSNAASSALTTNYTVQNSGAEGGATSHRIFDIFSFVPLAEVSPNGLLFNVTVNTANLAAGTYDLHHNYGAGAGFGLYGDAVGDEVIFNSATGKGLLTITGAAVPEPSTFAFLGLTGVAAVVRRLRKKTAVVA
jgi:hypothetical protein